MSSVEKDVELGATRGTVPTQSNSQNLGSQVPADRLYSLYINEAEKYDEALVARLETSSDSLLIFAGLFSATVTALIIESYTTLTEAPTDASVFYLAQIAQLLAGNSSTSPPQVAISPTFVTPTSAIRVNILWVLSLVVSLACALGATLIQTWTNRYTRLVSQFANVTHRAQQREFYFEGMKQSRLVVVAETLPGLLHLSLFLFLAGLVEFFFQIDVHVAWATLGAVIAVSAMYLALTLMPLIHASTPYQTPLSMRLPNALRRLVRRWKEELQAKHYPRHHARNIEDVNTGFVLRQSRALQWLLDRMTGVYSFDKFVEGIQPFLEAVDHGTRIIFQLNVNSDVDDRRRYLSAHIGFRLHSCLDGSSDMTLRRAQVRATAGALWHLLIRIQAGDMDDMIAPGGSEDSSQWHPASQHLQQWLHPYTLRALRRLRSDPDPFISLYAICTSMVTLHHALRSFCEHLSTNPLAVPVGWGFMQLLSECDSTSVHYVAKSSFDFDVLTTCLLPPPNDDVGLKSRAEETLDDFGTSALGRSRLSLDMATNSSKDLVTLTETEVRNTCHLAALILLLEHLLDETSNLQPSNAVLDMIQSTVKLITVNTNAGGTTEEMQRQFVALLERFFYPQERNVPFAQFLGGRATFVSKAVQDLLASVSQTLDHHVWARKAMKIVYGMDWAVRLEDFLLSDAQSGRVGKVIFDSRSLKSGANYFLCCEGRENVLDLSGSNHRTVLVYSFNGGDNQKWQLLHNGQYWAVRCLKTGTFLGTDIRSGNLAEATPVYAIHEGAYVWEIRKVGAASTKYHLYYAGTEYAIGRRKINAVEVRNVLVYTPSSQAKCTLGALDPLVKPDVKYYLLQGDSSLAMDLSGVDNRAVLIFPLHGGENQKWRFVPVDEHWIIQNIKTGAQLDADTEFALSQIPGVNRVGLTRSETAPRLRWKLIESDELLSKVATRPKALENYTLNSTTGLGSASLRSGSKYLLYSQDSNNALDVSGVDNKTVLIWSFHGGLNQKWVLKQEGEHWTIQSMMTAQFLCTDGPPVDGAAVIIAGHASYWEIRPDRPDKTTSSTRPQIEGPINDTVRAASGARYSIFLAGTQLGLAVGTHQPLQPGAVVKLSETSKARVEWRLEMIQ
ncbi:hypothetical protein EIP91_000685 [Steccherinum ochraceum]|uniref:Ricin B lectin domain-containing protein n=1 Tax=Steccherinum ochraceum TaxID=92696 RepID=A0A4R0RLX9_9APHY|nr:hypothetical protein EIP91_000685 [Steccherinum ochraceum]